MFPSLPIVKVVWLQCPWPCEGFPEECCSSLVQILLTKYPPKYDFSHQQSYLYNCRSPEDKKLVICRKVRPFNQFFCLYPLRDFSVCLTYCMYHCLEFTWQGFSSRGAAGVASVRYQELPLCQKEHIPAGCNMDLLLAKA